MEMQELLRLNSEGLIPGPGETEETFTLRVQAVKDFFSKQDSPVAPHHWQWAAERLRALFDFSPRWCPVFFSSKGLAPWQAAATWINQPHGNVKPIYTIQIRASRWVFFLIDRDELLAHEAAHAARAAFNEPKTEELFAYLTSSAKWRRVVGPIFSQPKESLLLVGTLGLGAVFQMVETIWGLSVFSEGFFFSAAALSLFLSFRLLRMRTRLTRAARQLIPLLRDPEKVRAVLFRMTDQEIIRLSRSQRVDENDELRWRLIKAAYFKETFRSDLSGIASRGRSDLQ
jgi:hypothetical protein